MIVLVFVAIMIFCIVTGLRIDVTRPNAYWPLVVLTIGLWGSAFLMPSAYLTVVPLLLGFSASLLVIPLGARLARFASTAGRTRAAQAYWTGVGIAAAPIAMILWRWVSSRSG